MPRGTGAQEEYNPKPRKISEAHVQQKEAVKEACEQDIAKALTKYNEKEHLCGEILPEEQQIYRVKALSHPSSAVAERVFSTLKCREQLLKC